MTEIEAIWVLVAILYGGFTALALYLGSLKYIVDRKHADFDLVAKQANARQARVDALIDDLNIFKYRTGIIVSQIRAELDCIAAGGHDYSIFSERATKDAFGEGNIDYEYRYICSKCGKHKYYIWDELTVAEQKYLSKKGLGE